MIVPVPHSFGSLREFNTCHAPESGQFCSGGGAFSWSGLKPAAGETRVDRVARVQRGASNPWGLERLRVETPKFDADDQTTLHRLVFKNGSIDLVHNNAPGGDASRLIVQETYINPDARGRGDGQKLLLAARDYAKSLGYKGVVSYKGDRSPSADRAWNALRNKGHRTRLVPATKRMLSGYKGRDLELFESKRWLRENQADIVKRFGIETLDYPAPDSEIRHIGYSPTHKKWYGWSHRAVFGFKVGDRVKKGDVIADTSEYSGRMALPEGFVAKTLDDAKRMAAAFAISVS